MIHWAWEEHILCMWSISVLHWHIQWRHANRTRTCLSKSTIHKQLSQGQWRHLLITELGKPISTGSYWWNTMPCSLFCRLPLPLPVPVFNLFWSWVNLHSVPLMDKGDRMWLLQIFTLAFLRICEYMSFTQGNRGNRNIGTVRSHHIHRKADHTAVQFEPTNYTMMLNP